MCSCRHGGIWHLLYFAQELAGPPDLMLNEIVDVVLNGLGTYPNGIHNSMLTSGTMRLNDGTMQAENRRTAVDVGINTGCEVLKSFGGKRCTKLAHRVCGQLPSEHADDIFPQTFTALQHDITQEPVGYGHVNMIRKEVVTFDVAQKMKIEVLAELVCFASAIGSLHRFGAVAEDSDTRLFVPENFARIDAAHYRELH